MPLQTRDCFTKEISGQRHGGNPCEGADDIEQRERTVFHFHNAGYNGGKSADERKKAGEDDRAGTVFFIKLVSSFEVSFFEQQRILPFEEQRAGAPAKPVARIITQY